MENHFRGSDQNQFNSCPLVFGSASISGEAGGYGFGPCSEAEAAELLACAWKSGITYYDTAPIYGYGSAERRLGRYLPKEAKIITKGGVDWHPNGRVNLTNHPQVIRRMIEESLHRLGRPIHVYMIHWPDPKIDIRHSLEPILWYQSQGLITEIGLSNPTWQDFEKAKELTPIRYLQMEGSYLTPKPIMEFLSTKSDQSPPILQSWGTLKKGILTGRVHLKRRFAPEDARSYAPWWKRLDLAKLIEQSSFFLQISKEWNISPATLAVVYNLNTLGFDQAIVGFRTPQDIETVISELRTIPPSQMENALRRLGPPRLEI
ncbi:MAG: aldo/keto reductase [Bdellovibrionaceae bacterium]|nr:aldo/keto reductase [Pseudobdellovibrionaceae bacterium]MDW8190088.1 aldo/keto reductase [Pseudobdellovibrionaceae bacterium]